MVESRLRVSQFACLSLLVLFAACAYAQDPCGSNPNDPSCKTLVTALNHDLCQGGMASMPGCSIKKFCDKNEHNSVYCSPFSVYLDICAEMPKMSNCTLFRSLCQNGSVAQACLTPTLDLPSTKSVQSNVTQMCNDMPMSGCDSCTGGNTCDWLGVYSELCLSMPDMSECVSWKTMCAPIKNWALCSNKESHNKIPQMQMFFHLGFMDYVLFKGWVPYSQGTYAGTWIAIFLATVLFEVLKLVRTRCEKRWTEQTSDYVSINGSSEAPFRMRVDFPRALLHTLEVGWGFLVMLVVMTYNVGLFFAVLAGSFVGMLLVGSYFSKCKGLRGITHIKVELKRMTNLGKVEEEDEESCEGCRSPVGEAASPETSPEIHPE